MRNTNDSQPEVNEEAEAAQWLQRVAEQYWKYFIKKNSSRRF